MTTAVSVSMGTKNGSNVWTPTISVPATGVFPGDYNVKIWINNENLPIFIYIHVD